MSEKKPETYKKLIAILGPTSSGKSALAIEMAKRWNGEIISADSRQVYRGMDIGTGKVKRDPHSPATNYRLPTTDSEGIPHHLLDIADPNDDYNISHFLRDARVATEDIESQDKLPIICGGTGFWIQALIENQEIPNIPPDPALREELSQKTPEKLFEILAKLDPKRATHIDPKNPRRLVRAIEIAISLRHRRENGDPVSISLQRVHNEQSSKSDNFSARGAWIPPATAGGMTEQERNSLLLALCPPKDILDATIKARLDARFNEGMIDEVARLRTEGVSWKRLDAFGLEYRSISRYLRNSISEQEMKERLLFEIIHYAKRQMTWIRRWQRTNPDLHIVETPEEAVRLVREFLEKENCSESLPNS